MLRKRRKTKQTSNISGIKSSRYEKCVFCEMNIDVANQIFVCDARGDVLHLSCFDERLEIINNAQKDKENK